MQGWVECSSYIHLLMLNVFKVQTHSKSVPKNQYNQTTKPWENQEKYSDHVFFSHYFMDTLHFMGFFNIPGNISFFLFF